MTITVADATGIVLTEHDHIVTADERGPDLVEFALPWSIGVNLHVQPDTPIQVRLYQAEQRAILGIGGFSAEAYLYLSAGQIDRLVNLLTVVRQRLS